MISVSKLSKFPITSICDITIPSRFVLRRKYSEECIIDYYHILSNYVPSIFENNITSKFVNKDKLYPKLLFMDNKDTILPLSEFKNIYQVICILEEPRLTYIIGCFSSVSLDKLYIKIDNKLVYEYEIKENEILWLYTNRENYLNTTKHTLETSHQLKYIGYNYLRIYADVQFTC